MDNQGPTARLAHWAATVPRDRTLRARKHAQRGIKDLVGCLIGGSVEPTAKLVAKIAETMSGPGVCTIVGHTAKVTSAAAAYANAAASHILDFDDSFRPLSGHPSTTIVPAILALAEQEQKSGDDILDAYIVGIEVAGCLGRAAPLHAECGWHGTATAGVVSTAVACARLLGLDAARIVTAISMAVSASSGTRAQFGYDIKCMQPAAAARDGVIAALAAAVGIKGCPEVLTGPWGWSKLYSDWDGDGSEYTLPSPTEPLAIEFPGITYKPYPACGSTHRTLDAVLHLCKGYGIRSEDIESIETTIPFLNTANLRYDRPLNEMQAKFSMPYTCAVAALYGQVSLRDFELGSVQRPEVQAFMPKVRMYTLKGSQNTDKGYLEMPCYTKITLISKIIYEDTRYDRRGEANNPLTTEEEQTKFYDCTRKAMSSDRADQVIGLLDNISSMLSTGSLLSSLNQCVGDYGRMEG